jgi:putative ATPase
VAPKSDRAYQALNRVRADIQQNMAEPVPLHLRNAATKPMREWGYGTGYQHAHDFQDAIPDMPCLPPALVGREYYVPSGRGIEKRIAERLAEIRLARKRSPG